VIMSSENIPSRISRCLEDGAEDFFLKPVQLSDVNKLKPHLLRNFCKFRPSFLDWSPDAGNLCQSCVWKKFWVNWESSFMRFQDSSKAHGPMNRIPDVGIQTRSKSDLDHFKFDLSVVWSKFNGVSIWIQLECVELNLVCDGMSLIENWWLGSIDHDGGSSLELEIGCDVRTNKIQVTEVWITAACSSFKAVTQSDLMIKIFNRCKSRDGHWLRVKQYGIVHRLF